MPDKQVEPSIMVLTDAERMQLDHLALIGRFLRLCDSLKADAEQLTAAAILVAQPRYAAKRASDAGLDQLCRRIEDLANSNAHRSAMAELADTRAKIVALERTVRSSGASEAWQVH